MSGARPAPGAAPPRSADVGPPPAPPKLPGSLETNRRLSQWLRLLPEGRVVVTPGKVEIGQGILTALAQIAADELDVDYARVSVQAAATDHSPNEGVTSGSRSVQDSGLALRHACAAARAIHLGVVAQRSGVPLEALRVEDGTFLAPDGRAIGSYWAEAGSALLECAAPHDVAPKPAAARRVAGTSAPRLDLPDKVFGVPRFLHDMRLPGMAFARIVRPPSRGARLEGVPEAPASARLVVDGSFLAIVCASEAEAAAAAARLAARARWAERDTLPPAGELPQRFRADAVETAGIAARPGSGVAPARTLRAEFFRPYIAHASIGTCCAVARMSEAGLEVWSHSQSIFALRRDLGLALRLPAERIVVHHREGAGCYGHNGADDVALDAALVARAMPGTPVRVQWSREDELGWAPFAAANLVAVEAKVAEDGTLLSWAQDVYGNGHLSRPGCAETPSLLAASHLAAPFPAPVALNPAPAGGGGADRNAVPLYRTGGLSVRVHRWLEMPLRTSSFRALGAMANVLAIESVMDELAQAAGRDSVEYRLAHLDDPRAHAVIEAALAMAGAPPPGRGEGTGRGLAFARYKGSGAWCAVVAEVEAEEEVRVRRLWIAADAGEVVNPEGAAHQIEGGAVQAVSIALKERVTFDGRAVTSNSWETYPILRFSEVPTVEVRLIPRPEEPPLGTGECATGPTVAAIANAIHDALGVRVRTLPFTAENIALAMG
ncbi:molybdopterin cofactor-binding domain-containing protein [Pararoseomonas indoligenes]|uniref:Xanthine dehydrogenase family protein molybdopterin-binding subunit n=1 Tax=Roseomonas indoligenes TaxID=2820811 RepID=A0A940N1T8_9PROT|nr:molybdopterin cofactor-binding domain-containing protein [Pararoseomonas indoligenes]MBP0495683.1 xanthine dehydrogenase family protein molybdopterin-binding subunit [Pararoseomonas indoligenes]